MNIVALCAANLKMEYLREWDAVLTAINCQLSSDECNDTVIHSRLIVLCYDSVLD